MDYHFKLLTPSTTYGALMFLLLSSKFIALLFRDNLGSCSVLVAAAKVYADYISFFGIWLTQHNTFESRCYNAFLLAYYIRLAFNSAEAFVSLKSTLLPTMR